MRSILYFILFFITSSLLAQSSVSPINSTFNISLQGGPTIANTDYGIGNSYAGKLNLEYFFNIQSKHSLGLKFYGLYGFLAGSDENKIPAKFKTDIQNYGGGLVYGYQASSSLIPYIFLGISQLKYNPKDEDGNKLINNANEVYKKDIFNYVGELGLRALINENWSIIVSAGFNYNTNDWLDDYEDAEKNKDHWGSVMLGVSYAIGGSSDEDGDGVNDSDDKCPNTPSGVEVDEFGCPLDSDGDGVPDYMDQCPDTPKYTKVDRRGCTLDSDGDGVPDNIDRCPDTAPGAIVDPYGCVRDSDNDGIPDDEDRCPDTPEGSPVDDFGCPIIVTEEPPAPPVEIAPFVVDSFDDKVERNVQGMIFYDGQSYVVQTSAWKTKKKAQSQVNKMNSLGYKSFMTQKRVSGRTWYRVRVGYYETLEEALEAQKELKRKIN